jgi:hypothetical protein
MSSIKGVIAPDELAVNKGKLLVAGFIPILFVEIKGLKAEMETADLPDATRVSGGRTKPGDFTAKLPAHHFAEVRLLEEWQKMGQDPVDPDYKKSGTLIFLAKSDRKFKAWNIKGMFVSGETLPDAELANQGDAAMVEFTFAYDDIKPLF